MKKHHCSYCEHEVVYRCPHCGDYMKFTGTGITTYGQVEIWNCKVDRDTWLTRTGMFLA